MGGLSPTAALVRVGAPAHLQPAQPAGCGDDLEGRPHQVGQQCAAHQAAEVAPARE